MKPIIYRSSRPINRRALASLELQGLEQVWGASGGAAPKLRYLLALDSDNLHFAARFPAALPVDRARLGCWREGLWQGDVAELFVADDAGAGYQEFNLSPSGEWWSCGFSAPRLPGSGPVSAGVTVEYLFQQGAVLMSIARRELQVKCAFGQNSRINVCSILGSEPRCFYSCCALPGSTPDFHQPQHFERLQVRDLQ